MAARAAEPRDPEEARVGAKSLADFVKITKTDAIPDGEMGAFEVDGVLLGIANVGGTFYAFHDCCTHQQYQLTQGFLMGERLTCDFHGASFDLRTGEVKTLPATRPLPVFPLEVRDGDIWVAVPPLEQLDMPPE